MTGMVPVPGKLVPRAVFVPLPACPSPLAFSLLEATLPIAKRHARKSGAAPVPPFPPHQDVARVRSWRGLRND